MVVLILTMKVLVLIAFAMPLCVALNGYDCTQKSDVSHYDIATADSCAPRELAIVSNWTQQVTVLQVLRSYSIPGHGCELLKLSVQLYCSWVGNPSLTIIPENFDGWHAITMRSTTCSQLVNHGSAILYGQNVEVTLGQPVFFTTGPKKDGKNLCADRKELQQHSFYRLRVWDGQIKVSPTALGKVGALDWEGEDVTPLAEQGTGETSSSIVVVWNPEAFASCPYHPVYSGDATYYVLKPHREVVLLSRVRSAFTLTDTTQLCGLIMHTTEDPTIVVVNGTRFHPEEPLNPQWVEWSSMVTAGNLYQDVKTTSQLELLISQLEVNQCKLERSLQRSIVYDASVDPGMTGFRLMGKRGWTISQAGEALSIAKCLPVEVQLDPRDKCYVDIPVVVSSTKAKMFMHPGTRILSDVSTPLSCTDEMNPRFDIRGKWYVLAPQIMPIGQISPFPSSLEALRVESLPSLSGLYSNEVVVKDRIIAEHYTKSALASKLLINQVGRYSSTRSLADHDGADEPDLTTTLDDIGDLPLTEHLWKAVVTVWLTMITAGLLYVHCAAATRRQSGDQIVSIVQAGPNESHRQGGKPHSVWTPAELQSLVE